MRAALPKRLTARQRAFLKHYIAQGRENAAAAYTAAGFTSNRPDVQASVLLKNPLIQAELDKLEKAAADELKVDVKWVVRKFQGLLTKAEENNDTTNAMRATENLGKISGAYIERTEDVTKSHGSPEEIGAKLAQAVVTAILPVLTRYAVPKIEVEQALVLVFGTQIPRLDDVGQRSQRLIAAQK